MGVPELSEWGRALWAILHRVRAWGPLLTPMWPSEKLPSLQRKGPDSKSLRGLRPEVDSENPRADKEAREGPTLGHGALCGLGGSHVWV